jgi:predicted Zn-dependent protease
MNRSHTKLILFAFALYLLASAQLCRAATPAPQESPLLAAMTEELQRSFARLEHAESEPLYYLGYTITDSTEDVLHARGGAIFSDWRSRWRLLDVDLRVGSPQLDSMHEIRDSEDEDWMYTGGVSTPVEDDADAIKAFLWLQTDAAYKAAQERLIKVKANLTVKVEEERKADDFSISPAVVHVESLEPFPEFDRDGWKAKVKALSLRLQAEPYILSAVAELKVDLTSRFMVSNEGTQVQTSAPRTELSLTAWGLAQDGMALSRAATFYATGPGDLPDVETLNAAADRLVGEFRALYSAPVVEPYHGPAILMNRAAGVFFHEIFGHRIEGHRQKMSEEGQTFTDKVGKQILPEFLSVVDDPTLREFEGTLLNGYYPVDDEGVKAERVTVVENGVLRSFLMSRSPIEGFDTSNGHGRREPGYAPVSRQGNLIVESQTQVPPDRLKGMLIEECRKQGKEYGLIFDDISGGFAATQRGMPQTFEVVPLLVRKIYTDGRPDEVVRGVDIVGTPLASFSKIIAAGDDPAVFDGMCGAESGTIPVSAVCPSILLGEIEIEGQEKSQDKPPILSPPDGTCDAQSESDIIFSALEDELNRSVQDLKMEESEPPYYVELCLDDIQKLSVDASFGSPALKNGYKKRDLSADVRVGSRSFDNTNFATESYFYRLFGMSGGDQEGEAAPIEDDYSAIRRAAWQACDSAYKDAVEDLAAKKACVKNRKIEDLPPDMSADEPYQHFDEPAELDIDANAWTENIRELSGLFREYPWIQFSRVSLDASAVTQYFVNNEGFKHRRCGRGYVIVVQAAAQAEDGMRLSDGFTTVVRNPSDLPSCDELKQKIDETARGLKERAEAEPCDDYSGPVLVSAEAAAGLIDALFVDSLYSPRQPLFPDEEAAKYIKGNPLLSKLGLRIFPKSIDITDDPTARSFDSKPLDGWYTVDDDGVAPQKITLVEDGKFTTFPMSRIPNKEIQGSNGHGRGRTADAVDSAPSNVIVTCDETMGEQELAEELVSLCRDEGLEYGIIIDSLSESPAKEYGYAAVMGLLSGEAALPNIARMYKVSASDGTRTPVRDATFQDVTLGTLKGIVGVGDRADVTNAIGRVTSISIVCPSMLFEEMNLRKFRGEKPRLPYLRHPYFENR